MRPMFLALVMALAACRPIPEAVNPLANTAWELRALTQNGDSLSTADGLPGDLMRFEGDGGFRVRSCNLCSGLYLLSDRHLVVQRLACTRRACPAERIELERYVSGRAPYRFTGDWLILDVNDDVNRIAARLYFAPLPPGTWEE